MSDGRGPEADRDGGGEPGAGVEPDAAVEALAREVEPEVSRTLMPPTPDIATVEAESVLPGQHRGGFQRLPTAPIDVAAESSPPDPDGEHESPVVQWAFPEPAAPQRGVAGWGLAFSILGLAVALFVGWGFPLGIVGVVAGIIALRRPLESRAVAVWAIVLGAVSIVYSAGWLTLAAARADLFG